MLGIDISVMDGRAGLLPSPMQTPEHVEEKRKKKVIMNVCVCVCCGITAFR
jgi:hypothetical protein